MYCIKCGAQLPPNSLFCTSCGAKVDAGSAPDVGPIVPPPVGQSYDGGQPPFGSGQQPPKKKNKALLWTLLGVAAVLIVAAVLYIFVFAPDMAGGPFSGKTVQTRFANDAVSVLTGAFDNLSAKNQASKAIDQPFQIDMKASTSFSGIQSDTDISAVYDDKALGVIVSSTSDLSSSDFGAFLDDMAPVESTMKMLLLEDVLYTEQDGAVNGIRFDTEADLSKPMPLDERISALLENSQDNIDYLKLIEMFLNSIDEGSFNKSGNETTLALDADALADTLDVFADRLEDDEELNDALSEIIKQTTGYAYDMSDVLSLAAPTLSDMDFELVWTVFYDSGKPKSMEISFEESGSMVFNVAFDYDNKGDERELHLEVTTSSGDAVTIDLLLTKTSNGLTYEGSVNAPGTDEITINGKQEMLDNNINGSVDISSAGTDVASIDYEAKVTIGMPKEAVRDDSRFKIDTDNATITDFDGSFGSELSDMPSLDMAD